MAKIFISHSTEDEKLIKIFVEFLMLGMGIEQKEVFCTSYSETLLTGENFIDAIRQGMKDCEVTFLIITDNYLKSPFCLAEMGAAWGLGKKIIPLLLVSLDRVERTPLKGLQVRFLNREKDISAIYDELRNGGVIARTSTSEYMCRLPDFMQKMEMQVYGEYILKPNGDGYYQTEIIERRSVPNEYRCYKIKGHIEEWRRAECATSDWLFFRREMYEELNVGEKVEFKISKTEENYWKDIGKARNIYPADLKKK